MDLQMPGTNGLDAIRAIRCEYPSARIVVLTMYQGDEDIYRALQAGATTYLLKDALSHELVRMVREVHAGQRPLPPNVASLLAARAAYSPLTSREVEVMELLAKGMRNKEIAHALGITDKTARVHVKNILAKLDVHDRAAAINIAIHRGIVHIQ
jgi:DNA-binding NarL/FixJ family response regulator